MRVKEGAMDEKSDLQIYEISREDFERFCQISRQTGFLGWDVKPSPPRVASKNAGLCMEENTVLTLLARKLTEPHDVQTPTRSHTSLCDRTPRLVAPVTASSSPQAPPAAPWPLADPGSQSPR
jgi:hypothetical protein